MIRRSESTAYCLASASVCINDKSILEVPAVLPVSTTAVAMPL
jgi:hypothetical protein